MQYSPSISPEPSPRWVCCLRQVQMPMEILSYLSSQWEMCSRFTDLFSVSMAFSTGMTCMPMPAPPSGTIWVTPASGSWVIRLKNVKSSGCSSVSLSFMTMNSALPGTKIGRFHILTWGGFLRRVISIMPIQLKRSIIFFVSSKLMPFIFASWLTV